MTNYDYREDVFVIDGVKFPLKPYRKWLLKNHEELVLNNHIKTLVVMGKTKRTFDWQHIFFLAETYHFLNTYLNEQRDESNS